MSDYNKKKRKKEKRRGQSKDDCMNDSFINLDEIIVLI